MTSPAAARSTLDARARSARSRREAREGEVRQRVLEVLRGQLPPGAGAWLISSLAWGGFGERSDVDLVLRGVGPAEALALEAALAAVAEAPVDLLSLEALPPSFQARVLAEGIYVVDT